VLMWKWLRGFEKLHTRWLWRKVTCQSRSSVWRKPPNSGTKAWSDFHLWGGQGKARLQGLGTGLQFCLGTKWKETLCDLALQEPRPWRPWGIAHRDDRAPRPKCPWNHVASAVEKCSFESLLVMDKTSTHPPLVSALHPKSHVTFLLQVCISLIHPVI
jgi:hypothetical protein